MLLLTERTFPCWVGAAWHLLAGALQGERDNGGGVGFELRRGSSCVVG